MSTQVFVASTAFGLATLAAALEDGHYAAADRRILVTSNNAAEPEAAAEISEIAGMPALLRRFDDVYSYNALVHPQHPALWRPRGEDFPLWQRQLAQEWRLDLDDLQLAIESIQTPPSLVLASIFADARIDVYGDGLMSYGPTRVGLPASVGSRVERLLHLDLVPGVRPLLLREFDVPARVVSTDAFGKVVDGLDPTPPLPAGSRRSTAVLVGQYLSANGFLTRSEEQDLYLEMVEGAVAAGFETLVFKPHPAALELSTSDLVDRARALGAHLEISEFPSLAEAWFRSEQVGLVVGCFSTALMTAASLYHLPTARVGTTLVLGRMRPFENSNRLPAALVDAAVPDLASWVRDADSAGAPPPPERLAELVRVVGYCVQPERNPGLRAETVDVLRARWRSYRPYLTRRRLTQLDLPGRVPRRRHPAKQALFTLIGPRPYRLLRRAWRLARTAVPRPTVLQLRSGR